MNKQKEMLFPLPIGNISSDKSKEIFVLGENIKLDLTLVRDLNYTEDYCFSGWRLSNSEKTYNKIIDFIEEIETLSSQSEEIVYAVFNFVRKNGIDNRTFTEKIDEKASTKFLDVEIVSEIFDDIINTIEEYRTRTNSENELNRCVVKWYPDSVNTMFYDKNNQLQRSNWFIAVSIDKIPTYVYETHFDKIVFIGVNETWKEIVQKTDVAEDIARELISKTECLGWS